MNAHPTVDELTAIRPVSFEGKATSFGHMTPVDVGIELSSKFELMYFASKGKMHAHDVAELAICTSGGGEIRLIHRTHGIEVTKYMKVNQMLVIPAGVYHYMKPADSYGVMGMLILYGKKEPNEAPRPDTQDPGTGS